MFLNTDCYDKIHDCDIMIYLLLFFIVIKVLSVKGVD